MGLVRCVLCLPSRQALAKQKNRDGLAVPVCKAATSWSKEGKNTILNLQTPMPQQL
jgi:hypothetical protein